MYHRTEYVGVRRLASLIAGLPADSAYVRAQNKGWSQEHELNAAIFDAVNHLIYLTMQVNADKKTAKKIKVPEPYPRPDAIKQGGMKRRSPEKKRVSLTEFSGILRG